MSGRRGMTRLGASTTGISPGSGYPWVDGDILYAEDLNAAFVPTSGGNVNGSITLTGGGLYLDNGQAIAAKDAGGVYHNILVADSAGDTLLYPAGGTTVTLTGDALITGTAQVHGQVQLQNATAIVARDTVGVYHTMLVNDSAGDTLLYPAGGGNIGLQGNVTITGSVKITGLIINAVNDAAAASAGVAVGGVYRNGSVLMVRVT